MLLQARGIHKAAKLIINIKVRAMKNCYILPLRAERALLLFRVLRRIVHVFTRMLLQKPHFSKTRAAYCADVRQLCRLLMLQQHMIAQAQTVSEVHGAVDAALKKNC